MSALFAPDGPVLAVLIPLIVCAIAAVVIHALIKIVGGKLLEDPGEADSLAKTAFVGILAVGVLLGLGRLVGREATDEGLEEALAGNDRGVAAADHQLHPGHRGTARRRDHACDGAADHRDDPTGHRGGGSHRWCTTASSSSSG